MKQNEIKKKKKQQEDEVKKRTNERKIELRTNLWSNVPVFFNSYKYINVPHVYSKRKKLS